MDLCPVPVMGSSFQFFPIIFPIIYIPYMRIDVCLSYMACIMLLGISIFS